MTDGENDVHSGTARRSTEPDAGRAASTGQRDNAAAGNAFTGSRSNTPHPNPPPTPSQAQHSAEFTTPPGNWDVLQKYPHLSNIAKHLTTFVSTKDLERFEADAKTCLPPARYDSLNELLGTMDHWLAGTGSPSPFDDAWAFFNREIGAAAAQARADAVEIQGALL
jgi:hypothetical protein